MYRDDLVPYIKRTPNTLDLIIGFFQISGFRAVVLHRWRSWLIGKHVKVVPAIITRLIRFTCNIDIESGARIGSGIRMPHTFAIIIGGKSIIGDGVTIMQCVTIGGNGGKEKEGRSQPNIGSGVFLGPGAKVIGPVVVGVNAKIGANSVVLSDVVSDALVAGVPAKIIRKGN